MNQNTEAYKAQVELARKAGEPIYQHDRVELSEALEEQAQAVAEAKTETKTEREAVAV
jgi:hypothetical protein